MVKYSLLLRVERETGTRNPETRVTWGCTRLPNTHVADGRVKLYQGAARRPEERGELSGIYHAIQHAEANGETLASSDIEVAYESLTHVLKRGKTVKSLQYPPPVTRGVSHSIFNEVNARKRPLGSDV
jgi:hypothetical protein